MNSLDFAEMRRRARAAGYDLKGVMQALQHAPPDGKWKSMTACPLCHEKGTAGTFIGKGDGIERFKCWNKSCKGHKAVDEMGYLRLAHGCDSGEAWRAWMAMAGVRYGDEERREKQRQRRSEQRARQKDDGTNGANGTQGTYADGNATTESECDRASATDLGASATTEGECDMGSATDLGASATTDGECDRGSATDLGASATTEGECDRGSATTGGGEFNGASNEAVRAPEALQALRWFYRQTTLRPEDAEKLRRKRGLTLETCKRAGLRSNPRSNEALVRAARERFSVDALLECGLWSQGDDPGSAPRPNRAFFGWGRMRKKTKEERQHPEDKWEFGWCEPILIPYFDAEGNLVHLRPHRDMPKDKPVQLFVVRDAGTTSNVTNGTEGTKGGGAKPCMVTEGEFKAIAFWQWMGYEAHAAALPGITMSKVLWGDLLLWLDELAARRVTVVFDNEEKSVAGLPGYVEKRWERHDTIAWAMFLAQRLEREGYDARVGKLPEAWRDANGKADWDGALALMLEKLSPGSAELKALAVEVLRSALKLGEIRESHWWDAETQKDIWKRLNTISYEDKLPRGGSSEQAHSIRLSRLVAKLKRDAATAGDWDGNDTPKPAGRGSKSREEDGEEESQPRLPMAKVSALSLLARKYREVQGGYYILKPITEKREPEWRFHLARATQRGDVEVRRAIELALLGIPERVSDFYVEPHYVLRKPDGTRERLITIHNVHGVHSEMVALPSVHFAQPSKWREWLLNQISGATWRAGERELNDLQADMAHDLAFKDIREICLRGYDTESGLWFFEDGVMAPGGRVLNYDRYGNVWHNGKGYRLGAADQEGQEFRQGVPSLRLAESESDADVKVLFEEVARKLFETIGNAEGWVMLGHLCSYAAAPELFRKYTAFPGNWVSGEPRQGKSSVCRWGIRIWGFSREAGINLPDSTKVGISIALQQYGNLPLWLEEYQAGAEKWLQEKLKGILNRDSGSKWTRADELPREIRAGVIVTGVATCSEPQTASRYAHVSVSESRRIANHYDWFEQRSPEFYRIGRWLMKHREGYAQRVLEILKRFTDDPLNAGMDARCRLVHGIPYASFCAACQMLDLFGAGATGDIPNFNTWLREYASGSGGVVQTQLMVHQFFTHMLSAWTSGAFGETKPEQEEYFRAEEVKEGDVTISERQQELALHDRQKRWVSVHLYFRPDAVLGKIREHLRRQGRDFPLEQHDLRAQMSTRTYWLDGKHDGRHLKRFGATRSQSSCWGIRVDLHPLGYLSVSDAEFERSLYKGGEPESGELLPSEDWSDPRRGELWQIIGRLLEQKG